MLRKMTILVCVVLVLGSAGVASSVTVKWQGASAGRQIILDAQAAWWFGDDSGTDLSGNGATFNLRDGANISGGKVNISGGTSRMEFGSVAGTLLSGNAWTIMLQSADLASGGGGRRVWLDIGNDQRQGSLVWHTGGQMDMWWIAPADAQDPPSSEATFMMYDGSAFYVSSYDGSTWTHSGAFGMDYGSLSGNASLGVMPYRERNGDRGYKSASISAADVAVWDKVLSESEMRAAFVTGIMFELAASGDFETASPASLTVLIHGAEDGQTYTVDYAVIGGTATAGVDYLIAGGGPACWASPTQCHGDTDATGEVKGSDFLALKASWYKCDPEPGYDACADFDRDGCVKASDFLIFKSNWYKAVEANCPPEGGSATLEFAPGETSKTIDIEIIDDGLDEEEDETIIVQLSNATGLNMPLEEPSQHIYTIKDHRPAVSFETDSDHFFESISPVHIPVNLSFAPSATVTVDYAATGGTATGGGVDYTLLGTGTLTFAPGETTGNISLDIVSDRIDDDNETIVITLSTLPYATSIKPGDITQFTWTIVDPRSVHLKVDLAHPAAEGSREPRPGTAKEGWTAWVAPRWWDMYGHGAVAMEDIAGTGVSTMISTVYGGLSALKVCGMCMPSLNGGVPYGSPIHDPICNSWFQVEDQIENPSGDIVMGIYNLSPGEYELKSYHNNFECHRNSTPACCDLITNPQPLMPSITALSLDGLIDRYAEYEWWPRWLDPRSEFINCMPGASWDHPVCEYMGDRVVMIQGAYNVPIQQVTQDSQLVPSLIRFYTDGSAVHIVYESGCCVSDGIRPARTGGRAILNAFELRFVGADLALAWAPEPYDGQSDVPRDVNLGWRPGDYASSHDVYFGTNFDDVNEGTGGTFIGNQDANSYDLPGLLDLGTTYYWRIDEVNNANADSPWKGKVWSFTTIAYLIVDDMESYDLVVNKIGDTWIDGWDNNTGSETSLGTADLGDPVHGGKQSMIYAYDNKDTYGWDLDYYSEVERTFDTPQDWTAFNLKALTLYFYGDPTNDANATEQMYVGLEDSRGVSSYAEVKYGHYSDEDMNDIKVDDWQEWSIALSDFGGVNLEQVKKVYIGLGIRGNLNPSGTPGGLGTVYFDDIRLYVPRCLPCLP